MSLSKSSSRLSAGLVCTTALLLLNTSLVSAPVVMGDIHSLAGIDRGELLFGELNCIACHGAGEPVRERLMSKSAPSLENAGDRLTPQYLTKFLADPHATKPGTTMPDALRHLSRRKRRATEEALVHYLVSLRENTELISSPADPFRMEQGKQLYHTVGCVTCHEAFEPAEGLDSIPDSLNRDSVPLGDLASKTTVPELAKFLVDPLRIRPGGRMPSLGLSEGEANAIAIYLLRDQAPGLADPAAMDRMLGLKYHYFEFRRRNDDGARSAAVSDYLDFFPGDSRQLGRRVAVAANGVTSKIDVSQRQRDEAFGFMFDGFVSVPEDGEYTFFTKSDDGSRLYINGDLVVRNDGTHGAVEESGRVRLTKGHHPIRVTYYELNGGEELEVSWAGPTFQKQIIPGGVLSHLGQAMKPTGAIEFALDQTRVNEGRMLFQQTGCANCHGVPTRDAAIDTALRAEDLDELKKADGGCLAEKPSRKSVDYDLSSEQRKALQQTVANRAALRQPLDAESSVQHSLARLNCYACHYRDAVGGPVDDRRPYFLAIGEADLGDEGRMPPHLTSVGRKLKEGWIAELLKNGSKVRPYMATRMPVFGEDNVGHLPKQFARADGGDQPDKPVVASIDDAKFGRKLIGTEGLSCIACHNFGQYASLGIPALNLTDMTRRLRKEWFHAYMKNPFALRPGTRMPSFWPDGSAVNTEVFDGNTERQIDAIWAFLDRDPGSSPPDGLVQGDWELAATEDAVIYRHFIEGSGSRAIGVGYPEHANISWDANEQRLALIWLGPFMDASKHRSGRGQGYEGPLGRSTIEMPTGPPLAILSGPNASWPSETGLTAGFRMRGYDLDERMRPTFKFEFNGVQVRDYMVAKPGAVDAFIVRTLAFKAAGNPPANMFFRAAVADEIIRQADGSWLIDGKWKMKFPSAPGWANARIIDGKTELLMPVSFDANGGAEIVQEIIW